MDRDPKECYDELASHYHLLFENWEASMDRQAAVLGPILERECSRSNGTRVLDCACGIGTQALGLAKLGFRISGCDLSVRAIERARQEASRRGLELHLSVANMLDLAGLEDSGFERSDLHRQCASPSGKRRATDSGSRPNPKEIAAKRFIHGQHS